MIALAVAAGAALALLAGLIRLFVGPTLYDRALAAKTVAVRAALMCAALAVVAGRNDGIDAAIALAFGLLVVMAGVTKTFRVRTFQAPLAREET